MSRFTMFQSLIIGTILLWFHNNAPVIAQEKDNFVVVTVATDITDGFARFNRSVNVYGLKLEVLGLNQEWKGGDIARRPGGGQKIILLRKYLESVENPNKLVVLFTDSYDVIINGGVSDIISTFQKLNSRVIFSSEKYCWPDASLESQYPKSDGRRFLNSGGFIGYASELLSIVSQSKVENEDDDQLYYTKIYLNENLRKKHSIRLDLDSSLFQNLNGAINDVEIRFSQGELISAANANSYLFNKVYRTEPLIVHGNGNSKVPLNSLGNYLAKSWHPAVGCMSCKDNLLSLEHLSNDQYPHILIAVNILKATPFFEEFLEDIDAQNYPKSRITLFIQSLVEYHSPQVINFIEAHKSNYQTIQYLVNEKDLEWQLRNRYLDESIRIGADYLFVWDSEARLTNANTLLTLLQYNKPVIAPMLARPEELWSNFWGALTHDGFYSRAHDYIQIAKNERRGIWNVPHISQAYLVNASLLNSQNTFTHKQPLAYHEEGGKSDDEVDPDMHFCRILRHNAIFMFVTNLADFGHLTRMDTYDISLKHPDFYEIYSNEIEWRRRYIHENYTKALHSDTLIEQPCPDVYWFPLTSPHFCRHLIEIMESYGQWSAGKDNNADPRLEGGYESVPTRDIHLKQVGLDQLWLYFLKVYIRPMQEKIYTGYVHDPPRALMNFVVRYHPEEQANLKPHHDSSTYTINIALNRPNVDYEGGGCRFIRYNCSMTNLRLGWSLIHPGRLTHYHEGLTVTKGVRYIMVSFVDP